MRILILSALLCALALAQTPLAGFNIGTTPGGSDVVLNGEANPAWSQVQPQQLGANVQSIDLFITSSTTVGYVMNLNNPFTASFTASITNSNGNATPLGIVATLSFRCSAATTQAPNEITINLPSSSSIVIGYTKTCSYPLLEVGTSRNVPTFVVNGQVTNFSYVSPFNEEVSNLLFWLDPSDPNTAGQPFAVNTLFNSSNLLIDMTLPNGNVAKKLPYGVKNLTVATVSLLYDCIQEYQPVPITLIIDIGWTTNLIINYVKNCTRLARPGLFVGFNGNTADVVSNGYTQRGWVSELQPYHLGYANDFSLTLNLAATPNAAPSQVYLFNYTIRDASPSGNYIYRINAENDNNFLTTANPQTVRFSFRCNTAMTATTILELQIEPFDSIFLYFTKVCVFPVVDVGPSKDLSNQIISNSARASAYVANANEDTTNFYLWLDAGNPYSQYTVNYIPSVITGFGSKLKLDWLSQGSPTLQLPGPDGPASSIAVSYDCPEPSTVRDPNAPFMITVSLDVGWDSKEITFTYSKFCGPRDKGSGMPPGGIAALVIFLLIFTGCVGGCLFNRFKRDKHGLEVVPGYDYYKQCFEWCQSKCCPGSTTPYSNVDKKVGDSQGITPQRDFNDNYSGSTTYGSYQSDHL